MWTRRLRGRCACGREIEGSEGICCGVFSLLGRDRKRFLHSIRTLPREIAAYSVKAFSKSLDHDDHLLRAKFLNSTLHNTLIVDGVMLQNLNVRLMIHESFVYISFSRNPAPASSFSRPANIPLKSAPSTSIRGASPLLGAFGLANLRLFSCPALDGNVGNMAADFGLGFSSKYGCDNTSAAEGLFLGFSESRETKSSLPAAVRKGNLLRMTVPVFCAVRGRRRDRALGSRRKPGQVSSVGIPQSSNIW